MAQAMVCVAAGTAAGGTGEFSDEDTGDEDTSDEDEDDTGDDIHQQQNLVKEEMMAMEMAAEMRVSTPLLNSI